MYQDTNQNRNLYPQLPENERMQPLMYNPNMQNPHLMTPTRPFDTVPQAYNMPVPSASSQYQQPDPLHKLADLDDKIEKDFRWYKAWLIFTFFYGVFMSVGYVLGAGSPAGYAVCALLNVYYLATVIIAFTALTKKRLQLSTASVVMMVIATVILMFWTGLKIQLVVRNYLYFLKYRSSYYDNYETTSLVIGVVLETSTLVVFVIATLIPMNRIRAMMTERTILKSL